MVLLATLRLRKSSTARQLAGDAAEDMALAYLQQRALTLLQHNFLCKGGEIDLVMQTVAGTLVFVEVRRRAASSFGGAAVSITRSKQKRLIVAAKIYLQRYRHPPACRFDVVAIDGAVITWLQNVMDV